MKTIAHLPTCQKASKDWRTNKDICTCGADKSQSINPVQDAEAVVAPRPNNGRKSRDGGQLPLNTD